MLKLVAPAALLVLVSSFGGPAFASPPPVPVVAPRPALPKRMVLGVKGWWAQRRALRAVERTIHEDPKLEKRFEEHFARLGGKKLWQAKDAWIALGIGSAINFGGYLQPEALIPYLIAGIAVDVGSFSVRQLANARARRKTLTAMIADHSVPMQVLKPHRQALGSLWPEPRHAANATTPASR